MNIRWKHALATLAFAATSFGAGAAFTAGAQAQTTVALRGEPGSMHNIRWVRNRLERLIDGLQHDQRDYGGHRVAAIADMQQARAQLDQAIQYDRSHPGH